MTLNIPNPDLTQSKSENEELDRAVAYHQQNRLDLAEDIYRDILDREPDNPKALYFMGLLALQVNNPEQAEQFFQGAIQVEPSNAVYLAHLGIAHLVQNKLVSAETNFRQALYNSPNTYEANVYLGSLLLLQERFQEAIWPLDQAVQLSPRDPKPFALLAKALTRTDHIEEAEEIARGAVNLNPREQQTLDTLTQALLDLNMPWQAVHLAQRLVEQEPDNPTFHMKLAQAYLHSGLSDKAVKEARLVCNLDPMNAKHYKLLSQCLSTGVDWDQALENINLALELEPENEDIMSQKASILERKGYYQDAYSLIRPLIAGRTQFKIQPLNILSFISRKFGAQEEVASLLEQGLQTPGLPKSSQTVLHFHLAELYDDLGLSDKAMQSLQRANDLKGRNYNPDSHAEFFSSLQEVFTSNSIQRLPKSSRESDRPIFIVGMPRSGTSLTEQILASHPQVSGAGELRTMGEISQSLGRITESQLPYPRNVHLLGPEEVDRATDIYLERIHSLAPEENQKVTDKMPQNFIHIGLIHLMFPDAAIVHCRRHPLDTCLSCYFQNFVAPGLNFSYDLWNLGHYFRLYEQIMQHWKTLLPQQIMDLNYESLVHDPWEHITKLLDFCGLEFDEACLRFYETKRDMKTASYDQVRQPIYTSSAGRWERYEEHLQPLKQALGEDILNQYQVNR